MFVEATKARIPVFDIRSKGSVFTPTETDSESGVIQSIQDAITLGNIPIRTNRHIMVNIPNPLPHHPSGSDVLFVVHVNKDGIEPWQEHSWDKFIQDTGSCLQSMIFDLRHKR